MAKIYEKTGKYDWIIGDDMKSANLHNYVDKSHVQLIQTYCSISYSLGIFINRSSKKR